MQTILIVTALLLQPVDPPDPLGPYPAGKSLLIRPAAITVTELQKGEVNIFPRGRARGTFIEHHGNIRPESRLYLKGPLRGQLHP